MLNAFRQRHRQTLQLLHSFAVPETQSGLGSDLTGHTECASRINRQAVNIVTMAKEMPLGIR
jgi:hypothetical protein